MQTPIQDMYTAAKQTIPAHGERVGGIASTLAGTINALNTQTAYAGDPAALVSMLHVAAEIDGVLRKAVTSLDNISAALIATANDYVATDGNAREDFDAMNQDLVDLTPPPSPRPPSIGTPQDPGYEYTPNLPPFMPPGSQGPIHVDPSIDPESPDTEQENRADDEPSAPTVPVPEEL